MPKPPVAPVDDHEEILSRLDSLEENMAANIVDLSALFTIVEALQTPGSYPDLEARLTDLEQQMSKVLTKEF